MYIVIGLLVALISFVYIYHRKPDGLPPGDWGWPIIGFVPRRGKAFKKYIADMKKKYGDIFCIKMGALVNVYISDYELIKESFAKAEFSGRQQFVGLGFLTNQKNLGLINSRDEVWKQGRRFTITHLRDFGLGTSRMDSIIVEQVEELIKYFDSKLNVPTEVDFAINIVVLNVIWSLVADRRFQVDNDNVIDFAEKINGVVAIIGGPLALLDLFPWLQILLPQFVRNRWMEEDRLINLRTDIKDFLKKTIKEHQDELDVNHPKDYIDTYLIEMKKGENEIFNLENLICSTVDLFVAGSETTSSYLRWFLIYMATHQDVQDKAYGGISSVIPVDRLPSLDDKLRLPYIEAVLHELHRCITLAPFGLPHKATQDMYISGFKIPKGTLINGCIEICHKSSRYWERPDEFYPERFLNEEGKFSIPKKGYLPFAIGKRICLGDSLVKMETFLFCTSILQRYKILQPSGVKISCECLENADLLNLPPKTKILLKKRE